MCAGIGNLVLDRTDVLPSLDGLLLGDDSVGEQIVLNGDLLSGKCRLLFQVGNLPFGVRALALDCLNREVRFIFEKRMRSSSLALGFGQRFLCAFEFFQHGGLGDFSHDLLCPNFVTGIDTQPYHDTGTRCYDVQDTAPAHQDPGAATYRGQTPVISVENRKAD